MWYLYGFLIAVGAAALFLIAALTLRALLSALKRTASDAPRKNVSVERRKEYAERLGEMIRCETVADGEHEEEFEKFRAALKQLFPLLHEKAELKMFNGCLVYIIKGKDAVKNIMLMSHHDVVAAEGEWSHPPFSGEIADGAIWGRGTIDTKTPLFAELSAVEELLSEGYGFDGINLYLGSSANEELCGDGIPRAVEYFKKEGIRFDVVSDEGGAIVSKMMPGVKRKSAMVAVHEKGRHIFTVTARTEGEGHRGLNPAKSNQRNAVERMAAFIAEVKASNLFEAEFAPEVERLFRTHAPYMNFPMRLLFSNFTFFKGLFKKVLPLLGGQVEGMLKTSMYFTSIEGTDKTPQIQAKTVTATAFFRCVREETLMKELEVFQKIADKYGIEVKEELRDYCRPSSSDHSAFKILKSVLNENFPDVIVSPFLLTAGTDARHFSEIADCILRFAPIDLDKARFQSVHNPNENIGADNVGECVVFYKDFIKKLAE